MRVVKKESGRGYQIKMTDLVRDMAEADAIKKGMTFSAYLRFLVIQNNEKGLI